MDEPKGLHLLETSPKKERREITEIEDDDLFREGEPEIHERVLARDRCERRVNSGNGTTDDRGRVEAESGEGDVGSLF